MRSHHDAQPQGRPTASATLTASAAPFAGMPLREVPEVRPMSIWASVGDVIEALDGHEEAANYRAEGTPRLEFDVAKTALHDHIKVALWSIRDDGISDSGLDVCAVLSPTNARNLRDALSMALGEA